MTTRAANAQRNPPAINAPTGVEFSVTNAKLYEPVATLSTEDDNK